MINYVMLVSRQGESKTFGTRGRLLLTRSAGKVRLAKWFQTLPSKTKAKIVKDVTQLVLARRTRMCNFLEYKGGYPYRHLVCRRTCGPLEIVQFDGARSP